LTGSLFRGIIPEKYRYFSGNFRKNSELTTLNTTQKFNNMLQVTAWNVGAQQQQQVCTTLSAVFFSFYTVSHYIYLCLKSLNDYKKRQLPPHA